MRPTACLIILAGLLALAVPGAIAATGLADVAGHYRIEPSSTIAFTVGQVGGGAIAAGFHAFSGDFELDPRDVAASRVSFRLQPASVAATQPRVTAFLKSSAVFDAARYPLITFRSTRITPLDPRTARIEGVLTARGTSRTESFTATLLSHSAGTVAFHVVGSILRSPYGMDVGTPIYSNVVRFDMTLNGRRP